MELKGVLSNHGGLDRLRELVERLGGQDALPLPPAVIKRRRPGAVPKAVLRVLASMPEGLGIRDIHVGAEALLGESVPRSTVKSWLAENARSEDGVYERVGRGRYRLRPR
jgi:hypothetical protein